MSIRRIHHYPDPILRGQAEMIDRFDTGLAALATDMAKTMYEAPGIGLAALQIGEAFRLIVVDISPTDERTRDYMTLVNPEIYAYEGSQIDEEGCLSVPELTAKVTRYRRVTVKYQDLDGKRRQITVEDRPAVVLQHEIDHLNGILFIDHLSSLKRNLYKKKIRKQLAKKGDSHGGQTPSYHLYGHPRDRRHHPPGPAHRARWGGGRGHSTGQGQGPGQKDGGTAGEEVAKAAGIPILQETAMASAAFHHGLLAHRPDLIVVAAYGRILPTSLLTLAPLGCITVHASLLPRYRGPAPIQWTVINGDPPCGHHHHPDGRRWIPEIYCSRRVFPPPPKRPPAPSTRDWRDWGDRPCAGPLRA